MGQGGPKSQELMRRLGGGGRQEATREVLERSQMKLFGLARAERAE